MSSAEVMKQPGARNPATRVAIGTISAAPAALVTLIGVLGLVFQTNPIRPYADGAWATSDLVRLGVVGLVVGLLNRSLAGFVGMVVGAWAAVAIQLFVLTEQASHTVDVAASLREPAWSGQVPAALAIGIASLFGGYVLGALAGRARLARRSRGRGLPRSDTLVRDALIAGLVLAAGAIMALPLVRATATSAYVPTESEPIIRVVVEGDRIVSVVPDAVPAGRVLVEMQRAGGTRERWASLEGPLPPEMEAMLAAGNDPLMGGVAMVFPATPDVVQRSKRVDLPPGPYAIVVSSGYPEIGPDDTEVPPVPALDVRRLTVVGPEPASYLAATGGPIVAIGYQLSLAITGWAAAGSLIAVRRGRNRAAAVVAGLVAAGFMWLIVSFTIHQGYAPF